MTKFIVVAFCLSGCAALEKLNTFKYSGTGDRPTIVERSNRVDNEFGTPGHPPSWDNHIQKIVTVNNPLNRAIEVTVECAFMSQGDLEFSIPAHSSQQGFVDSTRRDQYNDTCAIREWEVK